MPGSARCSRWCRACGAPGGSVRRAVRGTRARSDAHGSAARPGSPLSTERGRKRAACALAWARPPPGPPSWAGASREGPWAPPAGTLPSASRLRPASGAQQAAGRVGGGLDSGDCTGPCGGTGTAWGSLTSAGWLPLPAAVSPLTTPAACGSAARLVCSCSTRRPGTWKLPCGTRVSASPERPAVSPGVGQGHSAGTKPVIGIGGQGAVVPSDGPPRSGHGSPLCG